MVDGATNQQPQASQLAPTPSSYSAIPLATSEEEEFLKRNTDCVYFLASPLTCIKGSECEYRHSDIARVNPRDCWYWLNGNCLNPKCAFRHPPLDGLFGSEVPTPVVGPSVSQAPVTPAPNAMSKQGVACIFFQKGFCLKGHLCPFLHAPPNVINNKALQQPVPPNPITKPSKADHPIPQKSFQEQKLTQQESVQKQKPTKFPPPQGKQTPRVQTHALVRNGGGGGGDMEKRVVPPPDEAPRYRPPTASNEFLGSRSNDGVYEARQVSDNEGNMTGKEVDEYSREPTPGFDVLVDDELGESEYYPNEEQFGRSRRHDFEIRRSVDYDVDQDLYREQPDYDRYAWEDRRERMLGDTSTFGRIRYPRDDSPDQFDFDKSDLRHRISKQRRGNGNIGGLRSVVSHDGQPDRIPWRDCYNHRVDPSSFSSRLRGRINIQERFRNGNDLREEREIDMGRQRRSRSRSRSRYSPYASSNYSRRRDIIKGRTIEDDGRDYRGQQKRKYPRGGSQQCEDFEGPKPLSEILKRKRRGSVVSVVNEEDIKTKEVNGGNEKGREEKESMEDDKLVEMKGDSVDEDAMLDQELEAYDNGDYGYEQIDGEDYNLDEGENADEEYFQEEESEIKV